MHIPIRLAAAATIIFTATPALADALNTLWAYPQTPTARYCAAQRDPQRHFAAYQACARARNPVECRYAPKGVSCNPCAIARPARQGGLRRAAGSIPTVSPNACPRPPTDSRGDTVVKRNRVTAALAILVLSETAAAPAGEREVAYEADGYTIYLEEPGYCSLFLDTPAGEMVRMSYRRANGAVHLSLVRSGDWRHPRGSTFTAFFQFDCSRTMTSYAAGQYGLDDGRSGFGLINARPELLDMWAAGRSVAIRLESFTAAPIATIALAGSGMAIRNLRTCTVSGLAGIITPTVMPPPPESDMEGALSSDASDRRFPSGERITLAFEQAGIGGTGVITRRAPGQPTKRVTIGYMQEFAGIPAPDRIRFNRAGVTNRGLETISCEATIDWRTNKIVRTRRLSSEPSGLQCN